MTFSQCYETIDFYNFWYFFSSSFSHLGKFKGVRDGKKLTASEMQELLESSDHKDVVNTDNNGNTQVLTKEQLRKLLDRSDLLGDNTVTSASNQSEEESKIFKVIEIAQ